MCLKVAGHVFAGGRYEGRVKSGNAVSVCSGSPVPDGTDAVVAGEFCEEVAPGEVAIEADARPGRDTVRAGVEVAAGATIIGEGERLLPGRLGLAAAAGISRIRVYRRPRVAVISIGDEVVAPGKRLHSGQLYASNLVAMEAWLASLAFRV